MVSPGAHCPLTRGAFPLSDGQVSQPLSMGDGNLIEQLVKSLQRHTDQSGGGLRTTATSFVRDHTLMLLNRARLSNDATSQ